ncbi:unnamed protein product [Caenorhabditis angaria]|uniref:Uncharacterized protein n=1 Tax=Caenorhabditis angaria TaxID=860376 RepID=A0A9P1MUL9_9PELO|nr:unnamed protein product [Caenorhabditis angaria]
MNNIACKIILIDNYSRSENDFFSTVSLQQMFRLNWNYDSITKTTTAHFNFKFQARMDQKFLFIYIFQYSYH